MPHRSLRPTLLTALAALSLVAPLAATPAFAEEGDDLEIPATTIQLQGTSTLTGSLSITPEGAVSVDTSGGLTVDSQCVPSLITACLGAASGADPFAPPMNVITVSNGLFSGDADAAPALGWILEEGQDVLAALYDLPADGRIGVHASDELRGYLLTRILDILDRSLYGVELTTNEQTTLDWLNATLLASDRKTAQYAVDEFDAFRAAECGYTPPAAPSTVTDPVGLPSEVVAWCARRHTILESAFVYTPPQPTADAFRAWGVYRNAAELGVDRMTPEVGESMARVYRAAGALSGFAVAGGAAGVASAAVGSALTAGGTSTVATVMGGIFPHAVRAGTLAAVGAGAGAAIAGAVISAIVVTIVGSIQVAEYEQVGTDLRDDLADAKKATDPFDLASIRDDYAGLDLREGMTPANLPPYRSAVSTARIVELITSLTSTYDSGVRIPDGVALWSDNATTDQDYRFLVMDGSTPHVEDSITVPNGAGQSTIRFSRGWLVVDSGAGERPELDFNYVDNAGRDTLAARAPAGAGLTAPDGGFSLTREGPDAALEATRSNTLNFIRDDGTSVSVALVPPETSAVSGVRPSVVGPLTPDRTHVLRPNPVDDQGQFDGLHETGFDYTWTVKRIDRVTRAWVEVLPATTSYDVRFRPTEVGDHRASVLMHDTDPSDGTVPDAWGVVDFKVKPATPVLESSLLDGGDPDLRLDLQVSAPVPSNNYKVEVKWPKKTSGAPGGTTVIDDLSCVQTSPSSCAAPLQQVQHTLAADTDLTDDVEVKITDAYGSEVRKRIPIDDPVRPTFAPPQPLSSTQSGTVAFSPGGIAVEVPVAYPGANPNYELARLVRGNGGGAPGFQLIDPADGVARAGFPLPGGAGNLSVREDPATGEWVVDLHSVPGISAIGSITIPLAVVAGGMQATIPLTVQIVPSSHDRYRAALATAHEPLAVLDAVPDLVPYVMGGRSEWGDYAGDLCVKVEFVSFPAEPGEQCGPIADFLDDAGKLEAVPFAELSAVGVRNGLFRVSTWLATEGDRTDTTPTEFSFYLEGFEDPEPTGPTITDFAWDDTARLLTFTLTPSSPDVPLTGSECSIDGSETSCPEWADGRWSGADLEPGPHTFALIVVDQSGSTGRAEFEFTVAETEPPTPPTIGGFAWNNAARVLTFTVTPSSPGAPIAEYECALDGASVPCPDAASGRWSAAGVAAGAHVFRLTATDAAGAEATAEHPFTVTAPPSPGPIATIVAAVVAFIRALLRRWF
ncbi:hypothetical protein [Agromyces seonyuensis]|uniref:Ig-like domain-containing protein n=1 Tax=Agromyces seonyuensis TaxID=2662446 RepID=A0A6I4P4C9_9MICO|nr:hypothetical protein [Agromyces seonyuensis]MWB99139.1 hypothetical protein [Agromyces seonyuensis]